MAVKKYDVYLGSKKVRSNLSDKWSKDIVGVLKAGQEIKRLRGQKTLKVKRKMR